MARLLVCLLVGIGLGLVLVEAKAVVSSNQQTAQNDFLGDVWTSIKELLNLPTAIFGSLFGNLFKDLVGPEEGVRIVDEKPSILDGLLDLIRGKPEPVANMTIGEIVQDHLSKDQIVTRFRDEFFAESGAGDNGTDAGTEGAFRAWLRTKLDEAKARAGQEIVGYVVDQVGTLVGGKAEEEAEEAEKPGLLGGVFNWLKKLG